MGMTNGEWIRPETIALCQNGDDGRDQRPARAQGRPGAAADHRADFATPSRSAIRPAPTSSPGRSSSRNCSTSASARSTNGCAPTAPSRRRRTLGEIRRHLELAWQAGIRSVAIVFMHAWAWPEHERQAASAGAADGLPAGLRQPRSLAPDQAGRPRRHHRRRRLSVAAPAPLRPQGRARTDQPRQHAQRHRAGARPRRRERPG